MSNSYLEIMNLLFFMFYSCFQHDSGDDPYSVPPLGVHYSKRWAIEDLHSEQSESSRLAGLADPLLATGKGKKAWREEGG